MSQSIFPKHYSFENQNQEYLQANTSSE